MFQPKVAALTPKGEILNAPDDDQFAQFESLMKCGYEIVSLFWHSTAPGVINPYTAADVHGMAHNDYIRFIGPDTTADQDGMTEARLYQDLTFHGFWFQSCALEWDVINAWVTLGYPVILGIQEDSVYDLDPPIHGRPYSWSPNGLSHIILCTGADRFRDTANIGPQGVRPGPRFYDTARLKLISATVVYPSWQVQAYGAPPANYNPIPAAHPVPAPPEPYFQEHAIWTALEPIPFNPEFGIEASWIRLFRSGVFLGVPLTREYEYNGFTWQVFTSGLAKWSQGTGVTWYGLHGAFHG